MNNALELKIALYRDDLSTSEGHVYENVKTIQKTVRDVINGNYSSDISKIKRNIKKGCEKVLDKRDAFIELAEKFRRKTIKHRKWSSKIRVEIIDTITKCIDSAFRVAKKNSSPMFALSAIFRYLKKMKKAGHLNDVDFDIFRRHALEIISMILNRRN